MSHYGDELFTLRDVVSELRDVSRGRSPLLPYRRGAAPDRHPPLHGLADPAGFNRAMMFAFQKRSAGHRLGLAALLPSSALETQNGAMRNR
jgi:hypothetical protein